jgi:hypothetical protein
MIDKVVDDVCTRDASAATPQGNAGTLPEGALLNERQILWLRRAVVVMTTILVAGIVLLFGRVIYLARGPGTQAGPHPGASVTEPLLMPEVSLQLPPGATVKGISATRSRLTILHSAPDGGDGITVLDMVTGKVVSRVILGR